MSMGLRRVEDYVGEGGLQIHCEGRGCDVLVHVGACPSAVETRSRIVG